MRRSRGSKDPELQLFVDARLNEMSAPVLMHQLSTLSIPSKSPSMMAVESGDDREKVEETA